MTRSFELQLLSTRVSRVITGVLSFVGEDASGSFGILTNHAPMMTVLLPGLARFQRADGWCYVATTGATVSFTDNRLVAISESIWVDEDYQKISQQLQQALREENENRRTAKNSLCKMEEQVLRELWQLERQP